MKINKSIDRREFARSVSMAGLGSLGVTLTGGSTSERSYPLMTVNNGKLKISLNAYSFDKPLRSGTFSISDLLDYCAKVGFDGVDLTGYYFPGYPAVPSDDYIYEVKRKAFRLGLGISGTGVRNDFTWADPEKRAGEKKHVKEWVEVAEKLGAPVIRIFTGTLSRENFTWEQRAKWIAEDIIECAGYGKRHGVMIAVQNHSDFLKNASDVEKILKLVNSDWAGLLLDIGSYHTSDPYDDINRNARFALSWQLKEKIFINDKEVDTDYPKIIKIVRDCGYRGYLPLETLGEGDPFTKVEALYKKVKGVLNS
jgi:sugar phosphate isomerase/epimerase